MRPKSSATVVVVFCSIPERSSTPSDAVVMTSSVRSGGTSLTEPTIVVLPTPNPPAMSTLTAVAVRFRRGSEFPDAIKDRLQYVSVGGFLKRYRGTEQHQVLLYEVAEHHLGRGRRRGGPRGRRGRRGRPRARGGGARGL